MKFHRAIPLGQSWHWRVLPSADHSTGILTGRFFAECRAGRLRGGPLSRPPVALFAAVRASLDETVRGQRHALPTPLTDCEPRGFRLLLWRDARVAYGRVLVPVCGEAVLKYLSGGPQPDHVGRRVVAERRPTAGAMAGAFYVEDAHALRIRDSCMAPQLPIRNEPRAIHRPSRGTRRHRRSVTKRWPTAASAVRSLRQR